MLLPQIDSLETYRRVYPDPQTWMPAMREIAARHDLSGAPRQEPLGTHVVFGFGERIVKLFCPLWPQDFQVERVALRHAQELAAPRIATEGELEGWPYLVLTRVAGVPAVELWSELSLAARRRIVQELGELLRALHGAPPPAALPANWEGFLEERLARAEEHHDAPEPWRSWIRAQLQLFHPPSHEGVLLNGDLTGDHVLLTEQEGGWGISGVIDFGDARVGHPFYDFVAPLAYYTYGEPELSLALLDAYGLEPTDATLRTLTRFCLLHEFGRLRDFLARFPVETPQAFEEALWGRTVGR